MTHLMISTNMIPTNALRVCPEARPLNGRIGGEGEAPAEPRAEQTGPVCSPGSRGSAPAGERVDTSATESSRRGSAGASPSRKNTPSECRRDAEFSPRR